MKRSYLKRKGVRGSFHPPHLRTVARTLSAGAIAAALIGTLPSCATTEDEPAGQSDQAVSNQSADESVEAPSQSPSSAERNKDLAFEDIPSNAVLSIDELDELLQIDAVTLIDIRSRSDYEFAFIDGSKNIPAGRQIEVRMDEIPQDRTVALVSLENERLAETRQTLLDAGYDPANVKVVDGGVDAWSSFGHHVSSKSSRKC